MPEFYHLCSLDIVANRQLLHLWLNRFAEVSTGFQSKSFPEMIHHPNKHPFIINTYPYLIYIYIYHISLIVNLKGIIQFRWKCSKGKCLKNYTKSCQMSTRTVLAVFTSKSVVIEISLTHLM